MAFTKSLMLILIIPSFFVYVYASPLFKRELCPIGDYQGTTSFYLYDFSMVNNNKFTNSFKLFIDPSEVIIPLGILVPAGYKYKFTLYGSGVQMYKCNVSSHIWDAVGPDAKLYNKRVSEDHEDAVDYMVGDHYYQKEPVNGGRATWHSTLDCDNSSVISRLLSQIPSPDGPKNIPWLLLIATANNGKGVFSDVAFTIRLGTIDGIAPPAVPNIKMGIFTVANIQPNTTSSIGIVRISHNSYFATGLETITFLQIIENLTK
ncbi:5320_t:CDS:2 [Funneliformis mosseae]|uniref:5320_t:CDS:1 n=1 Tax=Funneliformis mosseae TaxID=27381 RepID=A0A9N8VR82_FUNMO|nr:5320_t:CDS:2 [Funneliformis mosseae]